jgi:hypothetical protein
MYLQPLLENLEAITEQALPPSHTTLRALYSDIDVIRNYSAHLLRTLYKRYEQWSPSEKIGDIFLTVVRSYTGHFPM